MKAHNILYSPPILKNNIIHRGVVATDNIDRLLSYANRKHWFIINLKHYIGIPEFNKEYDLYQIDPYIKEESPKPQVHVILRDFVDENKFYPLGIEKKYDIIFVARWRPVKRHDLLLETLKYAKEQGRPISCLCFGIIINQECQTIRNHIIETAEYYNLPIDIIPQKWDRKIVNQRYNSARSILLCSKCESGPIVMSEALLCGLPCISTISTQGPQNNYINDCTGIVCKDSPEFIAHSIWYILDNIKEYQTRKWALKNMCLSVAKSKFENKVREISIKNNYLTNMDLRYDDEIYDWEEYKDLVTKYEMDINNAIFHAGSVSCNN